MASTKKWLTHIFLYPVFRWVGFDRMQIEGGTDLLLLEDGFFLLGEDR
jgi:hypothetical protein